MGNYHWFVRNLTPQILNDDRVLDLGAGTGELGQTLAARDVAVDGLDLWPRPQRWPKGRLWHRADLLEFNGYREYRVVIGNLIFHQFHPEQLAQLGHKLAHSARVIMASEPARRRISQVFFAGLAPLLGANHVSLHDARVSIAAGFLGDELPKLLQLSPVEWEWRCHSTTFGAYRMVAVRRQIHDTRAN